MGAEFHFDFAIAEMDVGMVILFFSDFADAVGEVQGLCKIGKFEMSLEAATVHDLPSVVQVVFQLHHVFAGEAGRVFPEVGAIFFSEMEAHKEVV
jgi:hypothetical protein